ncbi:MAG: acylphosphatase [Candidatus Kerfeldbacteria bacterium]|nr:acylphosphatase [Candidatus Kerfeldbacteria bacterium]
MERVTLRITGLVIGVFFRESTTETATNLGLVGYVRNTPEGEVEIVAEGPRGSLLELREWAQKGPRRARVDSVRETWQTATREFHEFTIRYR